nr:hypothetical protein [Actinacidiphila rubida]
MCACTGSSSASPSRSTAASTSAFPVAATVTPSGCGSAVVPVAATGNAEVDAAVERLGDADELPVHAHIEVYEDVHQGLRDTLTALDENRG